uniref:Lipocalin/cytosolic fatty-acid binding domain-containing protein n=1 Tax=Oreochromis niloticus TaxID=8128 RepID=I3JKI3_ORENI
WLQMLAKLLLCFCIITCCFPCVCPEIAGKMKMGTYVITPLPNGNLDLSYTSVYNGTCRKMEKVAKKTDVPGKFRHISQSDELLIVDVKYEEYTLTYSINTKGNETYFVNKLDGRSVDLSAVQEKFRQFSLQTDFLPENIFILPKSGNVKNI